MNHLTLAQQVAAHFQAIPAVRAIALGGSQATQATDTASDIDLYVFVDEPIPLSRRQTIVDTLGASRADMDLTFWDPGDEWFHRDTGIEVDIMYWDPAWIEAQLRRVLVEHQASLGYTTCFWHTIAGARVLFDRDGWFAALQAEANQPYPEPLRQAIIAKNQPVLRATIPAYYVQIKKALARGDLISLNHRLAALLASYFDILFALNRVPHPGEKKIMRFVHQRCAWVPAGLDSQLPAIFQAAAAGAAALLPLLDTFLDELDALIAARREE